MLRKRNARLFATGVCAAGILFFSMSHAIADEAPQSSCVTCHDDYWQEMQGSVHSRHAISCHHCHGGDPAQADKDLAKAPGTGYIGVPDKAQIVERCGTCHADVERMNAYGVRTDQLARYKTSMHGKKLLLEGDSRVAACADCHSNHDVLPVSDPASPVYPLNLPHTCNRCHGKEKLMSQYKLPSDIFKTYEHSVHGKALFEKRDVSVAQCASCHGSHGAVPPGVKEIGNACGKCHVNEKKFFLESVHVKASEEGNFSECISCHGNHGVQPATPALYEKACLDCHDDESDEVKQGRRIGELLREAQAARVDAQTLVKRASAEGFFVEPEEAVLEEIKTGVLEMAPLQHTLSVSRIAELHETISKKAGDIRKSIERKRKSITVRKIALVFVWIFILVMVSALWTQYNRLKGKP